MRSRHRLFSPLLLAGLFLPGLEVPLAAQTWTPLGPEGGIVNVFAVAPSNAQVVYAGMQGGGVFRSGDGGRSWSAASGGLGNFIVQALGVDPHNASTVYAGTHGGFYKTVTAGAGWTRFGPGLDPSQPITALALDPAVPSRIYAGTPVGLYVSRNGGRRWALVGGGLPAKASIGALVAGSGGTILAGTNVFVSGGALGLWKSTDAGTTWTDESAGLHADRFSLFEDLLADPTAPGTFYARIDEVAFRSVDDGETFDPISSLPTFFVGSLAVAPSGTIYAGTTNRGVFLSVDRGGSFRRVAQPGLGTISPAFDATALAPLPDGTLLAGAEGRGALRLTPGSGFWQDSSRGLLASVLTALSLDPQASATLYAGVVGRGLQKSTDGGVTWHDSSAGLTAYGPILTVASVAVDPRNPERVYAGIEKGGLARSDDAGAHFSKIADFSDIAGLGLCNSPTLLSFAPGTSNLFIGIDFDFRLCNQFCLALRTSDAGKTLQCLNGLDTLDAIAFDPATPAVGYAASSGRIFRSTDSGRDFSLWSNPDLDIRSLLVDPGSPRKLYAGDNFFGVYRSGDRGLHFAAGGPLPNGAVPVLLAEPGTRRIFAGVHGAGVYVSDDGGTTWRTLGVGLPPGSFGDALVLDARHHILYAGTAGSGVYKLKL